MAFSKTNQRIALISKIIRVLMVIYILAVVILSDHLSKKRLIILLSILLATSLIEMVYFLATQ